MSARKLGRRAPGDPSDRLRAVLALPESREALPALLAAIDDPSPDVARAALTQLPAVARPSDAGRLRSRLLAVDLAVVRDWAAALCASSPRVRRELARYATALRTRTAEALLVDTDIDVRVAAVGTLARPPRPDFWDMLIARLHDEAWEVRHIACRAVAAVGGPDAVGALVPLLADPHPTVRTAALNVLDETYGARLVAIIGEALPGADGTLRRRLIYALERCRDVDVTGLLAMRVDDPEPDVRLAVAFTLGEIGGEEADRLLRRMLDDTEWTVRCVADGALRRSPTQWRGRHRAI